MLEKIFMSIVITSLIGTLLSVVLWLFKPITRKAFSASWNYYIWVCVLAVMIIPLRVTLPENNHKVPVETTVAVQTQQTENTEDVQIPFDAEMQTTNTDTEVTVNQDTLVKSRTSDVLHQITPVASVVWLILASAIFALKLVRYLFFIKQTRKSSYSVDVLQIKEKRVSARRSNLISSPLMTGVFKPVLILPEAALTDEQLGNVVLHEMTHYKRKDMLIKWFSLIVKSIHFFNPAVYFVCRKLDEECEISCDAAVVKNMTRESEMSYVNTILSLLSESNSKCVPLTTGMAGSKETLKKRFLLIKNKKRISKKVILFSIAVAVLLVATALVFGGILNCNIIKDEDDSITSSDDENTVMPPNVSYVGYIENAETDFIKLYTEKNGEYVMSIPWAIVEPFPANNRDDENYTFGWMEFMKFYCGDIGDFRWAVVATNGVMSASHVNVCTSSDNGKNWYVNNATNISKGIVDNAWFVSESEGYISYSGGGYGKGMSCTNDGGRTWEHKMEYDMPLPLSQDDALLLLKFQLITAYERRYGKYIPRYDDPGSMSGDKERLPYIIENLKITAEDSEYYTVPVIWDFLIEKETGQIFKFYDGLDKMLIPFDPLDKNALSFAG